MFTASEAEIALGDCPSCLLEREYIGLRQNIKIVGGMYWSPNCMLRCQCAECFAEFYISPQEASPGCAHRHKSTNSRIANTAAIIRVLETLFCTRFDDYPFDTMTRFDAYSAKYNIGIVNYDNDATCCPTKYTRTKRVMQSGQYLFVLQVPANASMRDVVIEVVNIVGSNITGFSSLSADTKLQFVSEFLSIMERLANANYDYPMRENVASIVMRLYSRR